MIYPRYEPTPPIAGDLKLVSRPIVVAAGQNAAGAVLPRISLLGVVTATNKSVLCKANATDGSQVPVYVTTDDLDTSAADVPANGYVEGEFAWELSNVDPSWTLQTLNAALAARPSLLIFVQIGATA